MAGITTFTMIKPDAFEAGYTGSILQKIIENGFKIKALRLTYLHKEDAEAFYAIHKERPFYNSLVAFMSSGPIVAAVLEKENAEAFYAVHKDRPFFNNLVTFMSSGPIVAAILEKENAVDDFRKLIGSTNPADAADGTVRKLFASSIERNAVHGSDSDENAQIESNFFFNQFDRH